MTEISNQNQISRNSILVRETPKGIESGKFKGYSPKGEVLVETSQNPLTVWPQKDTKTVEQAIAERDKKNDILSKLASIQHQIIVKLSAQSKEQCSNTANCCPNQKSLNYHA